MLRKTFVRTAIIIASMSSIATADCIPFDEEGACKDTCGNYGTELESFMNIPTYSNGGWKGSGCGNYQCVEFVRRFFDLEVDNELGALEGTSDDPPEDPSDDGWAVWAFTDWSQNSGLTAYTNGTSTVPPAPGDIYCQSGNTYGHVAIIKSVNLSTMKVVIIDQNRSTSSSELERVLYVDGQGRYSIQSIGGSFTTQGWLRDPDYTPSPTYSATYVSQTPTDPSGILTRNISQTVTLTFQFHNNGNMYWTNDGNSSHYVTLASVNSSYTGHETSQLLVPASNTIGPPSGAVNSGSNYTWSFNVTMPPDPGSQVLRVRIYHPDESGFISPTNIDVHFNVAIPVDPNPVAYDFDGDDIADVWDRTSTGEFHLDYAYDNLDGWDWTGYGYGGSYDTPAPGDYDGDGKYDFAILKNSNHKWYIDYARDGFNGWDDSLSGYGGYEDYPCPCDYDGDGITDISVRDADGDWHVDYSSMGGFGSWDGTYFGYGGPYDRPAPADYNGDGDCDFAVLRNSDRKYLIDYAHNGFNGWDVTNLGGYGDFDDYPCPADYDNDGQQDIAVLNTTDRCWRVDEADNGFNGWDYVLGGYGGVSDRPMPADYDGDGWDDVACYHVGQDRVCFDFAVYQGDSTYGAWDWCDGADWHPTWKPGSEGVLPFEFSVGQNYPNPFNPATSISFSFPKATHVTLEVYNILGQRVALLVNDDLPAGNHTSVWNAVKQASGIYFYRLVTEDADVTKKMLLLK